MCTFINFLFGYTLLTEQMMVKIPIKYAPEYFKYDDNKLKIIVRKKKTFHH